MPLLPYESQVDVRSLRTNQSINSPADPNAFGYQIGVANERAGNATLNEGLNRLQVIGAERKRQKEEEAANHIANFDFADIENKIKNEVDVNATNYKDLVVSAYRDKVEDYVGNIEDDTARTITREKLIGNLPSIADEASNYQYKVRGLNSTLEANSSLATLQNKITSDPTNYDMYVSQGYDVINTRPNMPEAQKAGIREQWKNDSAKRRFNGMLDKADSIEAIDAIAGEMAGKIGNKDWTKDFKPEDYESTMNAIGTRRKAFETQYNTAATAALDSIEDRNKSLTLIPADELQNAQSTVKKSPDPERNRRMARIVRDQSIIKEKRALPPAELRAQINAANGNPGLAYPDLPPEVSDAMNKASRAFNVDVGFLGGTVTREYGAYLKPQRAKTNQNFAPQVLHNEVDTRNIRTEVVDALTVAGERLGKPVMLVKGNSNDTGKQGASVSTVGMAAADKAKLVESLVDSGFTGVSEYDNHIRVDFLSAVPKDFGKEENGKVWGGWTNLSPEIVAVLKNKGFVAGGLSQDIKRAGGPKQAGIDYGLTTQAKDANGNPTSSAVGLTQFTEGTFLNIIKNPEVAAVMGVNTQGKTDAELLNLRKDPNISLMAAAAYASQNKKVLEESLGRNVSSAELYMAHFMGPGGATGFLNAYKNNPSQSAAKLLPEAAKANKAMFFDKGTELSVAEVYGKIANTFTLDPSRVTFEDNEVIKRILDQTEKELADDPMSHAAAVGSHVITALDADGGFAARGQQARAVAQYYGLSTSEMKPFTKDESSYIKREIDKGDDETTLGIMASIQSMGREPALAAMKQLEQKDAVFAHAGDLYLEGSPDIAESIIKGRNRIIKNPDIKAQLGLDDTAMINGAFTKAVDSSLSGVRPEQRQAIQDAALAHWVESAVSGNKSSFDTKTFAKSVQAVMGGRDGDPALGDINGTITWLPKGINADTMETAITRMTIADWARMSDNGKAPRYVDGKIINPDDIKHEVTLRAIGGGKYKVLLDDGTVLSTGEMTANRRSRDYIFVPKADDIRNIVSRSREFAQRIGF